MNFHISKINVIYDFLFPSAVICRQDLTPSVGVLMGLSLRITTQKERLLNVVRRRLSERSTSGLVNN